MPKDASIDDSPLGALLPASRRLAELMQQLFDGWPPLLWEDVTRAPSQFIARSVLTRQREALSGAVVLADAGLGHTALPSVRTACDELLWSRYLCRLHEPARSELMLALSGLELTRMVNSQQQHVGSRAMRKIGFTHEFVLRMDLHRRQAESMLAALAERLGWPVESSGHGSPPVGWIADTVGEQPLYQFLYSATSRGVHFSASEHLRRGWGNPGEPVTIGGRPYVSYRSAFVLHWLGSLLIKTTAALLDMVPELTKDVDDDWAEEMLAVGRELGSSGRVPIITPSEMAVPGSTTQPHGGRRRRRS